MWPCHFVTSSSVWKGALTAGVWKGASYAYDKLRKGLKDA